MKKYFIVIYLLSLCLSVFSEEQSDTTYSHFYKTLENRALYTAKKEEKIDGIKKLLATPNINDDQKYNIHAQLYNEYKTFVTDSAIYYLRQNLAIAIRNNDKLHIVESHIGLAGLYAIAGLYLEATTEMNKVDRQTLPAEMYINYYSTNNQVYKFYASLSDVYNTWYAEKASLYRDSLLNVLDPASNYYKIVYAEKLADSKKLSEAKILLKEMLTKSKEEDHERAVLAFALSNIYKKEGEIHERKKYLAISATCDIKNAIKENASLLAFASVLYDEGEISDAYKCIKVSMEDAMFCNAQLRTFEVSRIFPIIDTAYQDSILRQKRELTTFLIAISVLSLFLVIAVVYVYKQMKRVARIRKELYYANLKLKELNTDLQSTNERLSKVNTKLSQVNSELSDANQLKETYISHFLDLCSTYISKLEKYRVSLNKKATEKKLEELYKILKSNDMVDKELKELYENFDNIFLHLYPNFIKDFNLLLVDDAQFDTNATELNTELRIFALIRLGITDSSKIANFLHYSANTIYNYRTRMRNKAAVPREDFEYLVRRIGIIYK